MVFLRMENMTRLISVSGNSTMVNYSIIKNDDQHEIYLARLDELMDLEDHTQDDIEEIELLGLLISTYEETNFPIDLPTPIEAIKFRMDQLGLDDSDLVRYIGQRSKVSEILNGKRALSKQMIKSLHEGLGIPLNVLMETNQISGEEFKSAVLDKLVDELPLALMFKRNYFETPFTNLRDFKKSALFYIKEFLRSVSCSDNLANQVLLKSTSNNNSNKPINKSALLAWAVKLIQKTNETSLIGEFNADLITLEWMQSLVKLSLEESPFETIRKELSAKGIHVIYLPHLERTYLDGAALKNDKDEPVIGITLRFSNVDSFWFTLMHELSHVKLHLSQDNFFLENIEKLHTNKVEDEANELAAKALIDIDDGLLINIHDGKQVKKISEDLNIHPDIVAGRIRYISKDFRRFNQSFRSKYNLENFV